MENNLSELGFVSGKQAFVEERSLRYGMAKDPVKLGVKFLDDSFVGLTKHDLLLVGAKTGVGKTELITTISLNNAKMGKRVFVFALEAEPREIERRIRFKALSSIYKQAFPGRFITYRDFIWARYPKEFQELDQQFEEKLGENTFQGLKIFYRTKDFTIKTFERIFATIESQADLIIVDHIHFFDLETENENRELGEITKRIRDLALIAGVPVILVGHLRKPSEHSKKLIPDIYDFHGSSNLPKQITKGVVIESGGPTEDGKFITYMRIVKERNFGASTKYVGKVIFDPTTNEYEDNYKLCVLTKRETEISELKPEEYPAWMKNS